MNNDGTMQPQVLPTFTRLREILELVAAIRDIQSPWTTAEGLRQSIEVLVQLGRFIGVDPGWLERMQSALEDEELFQLVLAALRFAASRLSASQINRGRTATQVHASGGQLSAQDWTQWLPVIVQILQLLRQLRGGR